MEQDQSQEKPLKPALRYELQIKGDITFIDQNNIIAQCTMNIVEKTAVLCIMEKWIEEELVRDSDQKDKKKRMSKANRNMMVQARAGMMYLMQVSKPVSYSLLTEAYAEESTEEQVPTIEIVKR